jgi:transcriptional regulator with XRE-family HTH domain
MALSNTGIIPEQLEASYLPTPELNLPVNTNTELGLLDLVGSSTGNIMSLPSVQEDDNDPVKKGLAALHAAPTSAKTLAAPTFFDYERSQASRYTQAEDYKTLGFNPAIGQENEYRYGARQTWGDVWSNGLTGMFKLAGNTFIEGWKGWGNLVDAVYSEGKWFDGSKLMGSEEELIAQDKSTKDIMNKYAIFATPESEEGVFNRKFFGDMLQQSGFAVGTIAQFLSEELLTFGLSTEFSLAKLGLKAPSWAGKVVTKADIAKDLVKLGNPVWKAGSFTEGLVQGARKVVPFLDTAYKLEKYGKAGAGALQLASIGVGGVRRILSEANMSMTEARMESAGTYAELYNKLYDEHVAQTGEAPNGEKMADITRIAKDAAYDNFKVNSAILMLSNRLQFDNLFSKFNPARELMSASGEFAEDVLKVSAKRLGAEGAEDFTKLYSKGKLGTLGLVGDISKDFGRRTAAWEATKSLGKNLFKWETSEGLQELFQESSNIALQDYYYDLYHGNKDANLSKSIDKATESQVNVQGLKTFLMGAVTGRLLSPINFAVGQAKYYAGTSAEDRAKYKTSLDEAVGTVNAFYNDKTKVLNENIANVKVQNTAAKNMEEAIKNRDHYVYSNNKDSAFAKLVSASMKTGMFEAVTDTIREYGDSFTDDQFKSAFGLDRTKDNISSVKDFFNKVADETVDFQKTWKSLKDKYGDAVMVDLYKEGTPERNIAISAKRALDDAIEILATNDYKAKRATERAVELQTKMASTPVLGSSLASAFRTIGVIDNTQKEIDILKKEVAAMEQSGVTLDKSTKALLKSKRNQINALENWKQNYESLQKEPRENKRKSEKARKALEGYVNSKNAESGIDVVIKNDELSDHYENLLDYIELNKDNKEYIDAYNILANPINFVKAHSRLMQASDEAIAKLKGEHLQEIVNNLKGGNPPQEGGKVPTLDDYLKEAYQSQVDSDSFSGTYEEWLESPIADTFLKLYNQKYKKSESLKKKTVDTNIINQLNIINEELGSIAFTTESINEIFNKLAAALKISVEDVKQQYKEFLDSFTDEQIKKELAAFKISLDDYTTPEEKHAVISQFYLPMFVDSLIEKQKTAGGTEIIETGRENHDIFPLPVPKIKMTAPRLFNTKAVSETLVDSGKDGIFIIEIKEKKDENIVAAFEEAFKQTTSNFIKPEDTGKFIVVDSDRKDPNTGNEKGVTRYTSKEDAIAARNIAIEKRTEALKKADSYFTFDGQEIKAGLVLERKEDGKEYVVISKGEPYVGKDASGNPKPPTIQIKELRGQGDKRIKLDQGYTLTNLNSFNIKQKVETTGEGEVIDPNVFRLVRSNELSRIYPHQNRETGESKEAAQARLDEILKTTSAEELQKNLTVTIKQFTGDRKETVVGSTSSKIPNKNLRQYSDRYQIQILYKGTILGYLTNYDTFRFVDDNGQFIEMSDLTLNQFRKIFDVNGKDINKELAAFKESYVQSKKIAIALAKFIKPGEDVTISSEEVGKILNINIGNGEFDFVNKENGEKGVKYEDLPYKTINGFYYIIDSSRRYGKGYTYKLTKVVKTNADGADKKQIEKEIKEALSKLDVTEQTGRYTAVVKLPNGTIKFIELTTDVISDDNLNNIVNQINERSKLTKEKNTEKKLIDGVEKPVRKKLDFNEKLNTEISDNVFITVPLSTKGTYIIMGVTDTGNLELEFHKKVGDKDIRRVVTLHGPTLFDPVEIKDVDDLVNQINNAIVAHDNNPKVDSEFKIGFTLTKENFKQSTADVLDTKKDLPNLKTNVNPNIVKNISFNVTSTNKTPVSSVSTKQTVTKSLATPAEVAVIKTALNDPRVDISNITSVYGSFINSTYSLKYGEESDIVAKIAKLYAEISKIPETSKSKEEKEFFNFVNNRITSIKYSKEEVAFSKLKNDLINELYAANVGSSPDELNQKIKDVENDLSSISTAIFNKESITGAPGSYQDRYNKILEQTPDQLSPLQKAQGVVTSTQTPVQSKTEEITETNKLAVAEKELTTLLQEKENEQRKIRDEKRKNGVNYGKASREAEEEASKLYNDRISEKTNEINNLKNISNAPLKVVDKPVFNENSIITINRFKDYIKRILGDKVSVEELEILTDNLKTRNLTVGRFITYMEMLESGVTKVKGRIEVGKDTPFKYHEAFHAVFRLMLSNKEIEKLLGYAKIDFKNKLKAGESISSKMAEMRTLHTIYADMSDKDLEERMYEEYMADEFDSWKITKDSKKVMSGIAKVFQRFLDFIKSFFSRSSASNIEAFFKDIDRGKYKNSKVRNNRFTERDALNITEPVLKAIKVGVISVQDENGLYINIDKHLSQEEGDKIASTVASMFHTKALSAENGYNKKETLLDIIDQFIELYDPEGPNENFYEQQLLALEEVDPTQAEAYYNKLKEKHEVFVNSENRKTLLEAVDTHLRIMGFKQELEEDDYISTEDEFGTRVTTDNWKETFTIGGFGSLSQFLRQYIATTSYSMDKDEFGNTQFVNGEPLLQSVNANLVYNGILKSVANISDQNKFIRRLIQLEKNNNTETGKFLNKFFSDVDLVFDDESNTFTINNSNQATLFQSVIKGFQQYAVDDLFINKDIRESKKLSRIMLANRMGAAKAQITQWQNAYVRIFQDVILRLSDDAKVDFAKERTSALQDILTNLDSSIAITDEQLTTKSQVFSNALKEELGISISPLFLEFSIAAAKDELLRTVAQNNLVSLYDDVEPIDETTVKQIIKSIQALEDPFAKNIDTDKLANQVTVPDENEEAEEEVDDLGEGGVITRLNDIAKSNAIFDETVNTSSYKNAENELVYGYQLPTYHLVKINDFNNSDNIAALSEDEFLQDNYLLTSSKFRSLIGKLKVSRIGGMKSSILTEDENGNVKEDKTIQSNQNKGITYGKFSPREFLISLMELYGYNQKVVTEDETFYTTQHLIRVIEASNTGDTIGLAVIKAVDTNEETNEVNLSDEALDILYKEVEREFNRIKSVRNQITTQQFPEGEIEGYHYAVDDDGKRDPKKTPRGLKFFNVKEMLGELLSSDLEQASKDDSYSLSSRENQIKERIKRYWNEEINETIEILKENNIVSTYEEEGVEKIQNNLVDDFIVKGFVTRKDGKNVIDERKNQDLNLIPGNFKHNFSQVYINDFINTLAINQLLHGDEAKGLKNAIDQIKRAKGANGSGSSLESIVISPELGITEQFTESHILQFTDPLYKANFAGGKKEKADAQSYQSVKSARYTMFGLGKLTPFLAKIFDKLEQGIELTEEEVFGQGGLKDTESMLNSLKLVYFGDLMYIKTSTVILTKELTSMKVDGKWVAIPGSEDLHNLRERLEKFEKDNSTVAFAAPKSASKGIKQNVFNYSEGFQNAKDSNFTKQKTKYWRLQLVNPSNKIKITDPTQAKQIIIGEQNDNLEVEFMGQKTDDKGNPLTIGQLKNMYLDDTKQRVENNYTRRRDEIFNIDKAFSELGKSIDQNKISADLAKFQESAIETLRSTGADSQMLEFFAVDEKTKQPKYNLNNPVTLDKYTQLFLAYFSKDVMSEKVPGHSVALMSNYGMKVVKVFTGRYDENGTPIGEVVQRALIKKFPSKYANPKKWNDNENRTFDNLIKGDIYIDDLRHNVPEFDKQGNIIGRYAEFMMPPHFLEDMGLKPGDPIPEHLLKIFGVRIPSQDKHSFISVRLVDFLPAFYGSTAIFPHELIEISGADFDIDKLYMHIVDTYSKNGKRVAYGTETSKEGKFNEFVSWHSANNKAFKKELKELKENDPAYISVLKKIADIRQLKKELITSEEYQKLMDIIPESEKQIRDSFKTLLSSTRLIDATRFKLSMLNKDSDSILDSESIRLLEDAVWVKDFNELLSAFDKRDLDRAAREYGFQVEEDIINYIKSLKSLTKDLDNINTRLIGVALDNVKLPNSITKYAEQTKELNNGILNNRILNQKLVFLTNEHMVSGGTNAIAYQVASLKALTDLLDDKNPDSLINLLKDENEELPEEIFKILIEKDINVNTIRGKFKSFKNNKEGSRNIGPAVNAMQVSSVLNTFGIKLRDTFINEKGEVVNAYKFTLNGHTFDGYTNTRSYNPETGKYDSTDRISDMISTIVSAMTDNAKERLAARLGLNIEAVGYVSNMVAQGVPLKSAIMLMLQPVVREYFNLTSIINNNVKTGVESQMFKSQVTKELLNKYVKAAGEEYQKENLTDDILINNIKDNGSSATYQLSVLQDFIGIMEQSRYFSSVAQILKLTKGLGTSFEDYDKIKDVIQELGLNIKNNEEFEKYKAPDAKTPPPFDLRQLFMGYDSNKSHHSFIKGYIQIANQIDQISKGVFIEKTDVFKRIENIVKANLKVKFNLKETFNNELKKDLISYLSIKVYQKYLKDNNKAGTLSTMTNALIYDDAAKEKGDDFMDIIDSIKVIRDVLPDNYITQYLLNAISTTKADASGNVTLNPLNRDGINKLETNTWAKLSEFQIEKIRDSFIEIYQSDLNFAGKNGREMANTLFNYILVKDGGQFRSGSFMRYIPNFMFDDLLKSTGKANDLLKLSGTSEELDEKYEKLFGVKSSDLFIEFMENYVTHVGNSPYVAIKPIATETKSEITGDAKVDAFVPQAVTITPEKISIDIFKGIRGKEQKEEVSLEEEALIEWMDDFDYLEYLESLSPEEKKEIETVKVKSKKYNSTEKAMFKKNMQDLFNRGFSKNKKGEVLFPYIFRVRNGNFTADSFYILTSVRKSGDKKTTTNSKLFIKKNEQVASGIAATYELIERKGSKKTFKGGAVFDPIPSTASTARYRATREYNPKNYTGYYQKNSGNQVTEENFMLKYGFPVEAAEFTTPFETKNPVISTEKKIDYGNKTAKEILLTEYGITMEFKDGKIIFAGDIYEGLVDYHKKQFTKPSDILEALNHNPIKPVPNMTKPVVEEPSATTFMGMSELEKIKAMIGSSSLYNASGEKQETPSEFKSDTPLNDSCA